MRQNCVYTKCTIYYLTIKFKMNLNEEIHKSNDLKRIISFLMNKVLINTETKCTRCKRQMHLKERLTDDHFTWRCPKCSTFKSLRSV